MVPLWMGTSQVDPLRLSTMLKTSFSMESSLSSGPREMPLKLAPRALIQRHFATARPLLSSRMAAIAPNRDGWLVYVNAAPDVSTGGGRYTTSSVADRSSPSATVGTPPGWRLGSAR